MNLRSVVLISTATLIVGAAVWLSPRPADAATDLTGSWTFDWMGAPGPPPIPCTTGALKQQGTALSIYIACPLFYSEKFSGTYDKGTGAFTVSSTFLCKGFIEIPWTITGTVSMDGNSMSGTWSTICISVINGTFSAVRSGPATVTITPQPTSTPTATPTPTATATCACLPTDTPTPPPVGGMSQDASLRSDGDTALPLVGVLTALIGSAACAGVWYARWRA